MTNGKADRGGGMYLFKSSPTLTNCTFTGNTTDQGGGMALVDSSPTLVNTILWGNGTELYLWNMDASTPKPVLRSCVVPPGGIVSDDKNVVSVDAADLAHGDPKLLSCDLSGTVSSDVASVDLGCYALDTGSSALGWGLSVGSHMIAGRTVEVPAKDQRGQARPSSGPTDVGSWQSGATPPTTTPPTTTPPGAPVTAANKKRRPPESGAGLSACS